MKWRVQAPGHEEATVGHLFAYVDGNGGYKEPGHPDYEPETFNWFIAPHDEDKNYRDALAQGNAATMDAAKFDVECALHRIRDKLSADMGA